MPAAAAPCAAPRVARKQQQEKAKQVGGLRCVTVPRLSLVTSLASFMVR